MARCQICGGQCDGKTVIHDKTWAVYGEAKLCKTCFHFWSTCNDEALLGRVNAKLRGKGYDS